jgi:hypothetical protein
VNWTLLACWAAAAAAGAAAVAVLAAADEVALAESLLKLFLPAETVLAASCSSCWDVRV